LVLFEGEDSAHARLIKTRCGTWIDESLLPAARRECEVILRKVACEFGDQGIVKMLRGEWERLEGTPLADEAYSGERESHIGAALRIFRDTASRYELREEREAHELAYAARRTMGLCGSCGRKLPLCEPAYFGAEVYVGMPHFWQDIYNYPRLTEPRYSRTVLFGSCAPDSLSPSRDDVVTQLCGHCERPIVQRLKPSKVERAF
jgi:hypothetical protein